MTAVQDFLEEVNMISEVPFDYRFDVIKDKILDTRRNVYAGQDDAKATSALTLDILEYLLETVKQIKDANSL